MVIISTTNQYADSTFKEEGYSQASISYQYILPFISDKLQVFITKASTQQNMHLISTQHFKLNRFPVYLATAEKCFDSTESVSVLVLGLLC